MGFRQWDSMTVKSTKHGFTCDPDSRWYKDLILYHPVFRKPHERTGGSVYISSRKPTSVGDYYDIMLYGAALGSPEDYFLPAIATDRQIAEICNMFFESGGYTGHASSEVECRIGNGIIRRGIGYGFVRGRYGGQYNYNTYSFEIDADWGDKPVVFTAGIPTEELLSLKMEWLEKIAEELSDESKRMFCFFNKHVSDIIENGSPKLLKLLGETIWLYPSVFIKDPPDSLREALLDALMDSTDSLREYLRRLFDPAGAGQKVELTIKKPNKKRLILNSYFHYVDVDFSGNLELSEHFPGQYDSEINDIVLDFLLSPIYNPDLIELLYALYKKIADNSDGGRILLPWLYWEADDSRKCGGPHLLSYEKRGFNSIHILEYDSDHYAPINFTGQSTIVAVTRQRIAERLGLNPCNIEFYDFVPRFADTSAVNISDAWSLLSAEELTEEMLQALEEWKPLSQYWEGYPGRVDSAYGSTILYKKINNITTGWVDPAFVGAMLLFFLGSKRSEFYDKAVRLFELGVVPSQHYIDKTWRLRGKGGKLLYEHI